MKKPILPSIETLCAYHDKELPESERQAVEAALRESPESLALLEDFATLDTVGPHVEERLPGESYWLDLPDRILARAAVGEQQASSGRRSSWQRFFAPQGAWGWAVGATALVAVAGVSWLAMRNSDNPVNPLETEAVLTAGTEGVSEPPDDLDDVSEMSPEMYTQRVLMTLGGEGNIGESLDILAVDPVSSPPSAQSPLHQVSMALGPEMRQDMERVICDGPGKSSPIEEAFLCALKAEEVGRYDLARQGYALVLRRAPKDHPIHWQADFRLTFHKWATRMNNAPGLQRVRMIEELNQLAHQTYQRWQQSGQMQDCQKAYCLNKTLVQLVQGDATPTDVQQTNVRVDQLQDCLK